jgi:quinol-cytochrome oxidoreductase complex cytochrome b subunit
VEVSAAIKRGGEDVSADTLTRFFSFHVCILPLLLLGVMAAHIFLILKLGMSLFLFQTLKIFPAEMLFVNGDTVAVLLILLGGVLFFFLSLIDNKPAERKGKIIIIAAFVLFAYALVMNIWSLLE